MSRIGKKPIELPHGVTVVKNGRVLSVAGPRGNLTLTLRPEIDAEVQGAVLKVVPVSGVRKVAALWGLTRALLAAMVEGVSRGFERKLEIEGIGYRAGLDGGNLQLAVGFSHPIEVNAPPGISFKVEKNVVTVSGIDKELVGDVAAKIRKIRPPEPYKGKGIRYLGERIRRKAGKKAVVSSA